MEKITVAAMLRERTESMRSSQGGQQGLRGFHVVIIALWLLLLGLSGCGYKTDPVYMPAGEHNVTNPTDGAR